MRPYRIALAAASLALSLQAADALAVDCFEIIDKDQNVTYRASFPPFGMDGEEWRKGQDHLRASNQHLRWQTLNDCSPMITHVARTEASKAKSDLVFDPDVILRATPDYMSGSGRYSTMQSSRR